MLEINELGLPSHIRVQSGICFNRLYISLSKDCENILCQALVMYPRMPRFLSWGAIALLETIKYYENFLDLPHHVQVKMTGVFTGP